ncbi:Crp/Fnr family transcriptional regulator [Moraxellaceae bacterium AER2_44_116]|nr:Crp/Fnr family transcriptional regulator [Moraxellaceae bacterium]TQD00051.1 Crp/Fnr family transcriptional regulator [Moraxellaceae bacterium AER2_44_116]
MDNHYLTWLQAMPVFGGMNEQALAFLIQHCPEVVVDEGEYFFREGDEGNSLFILESGTALVVKGQNLKLRQLARGDCFGEMTLIDLNPRSASVLALEPCLALELSNQTLFLLYETHLEQFALIQMNLLREVSRRLRYLDERLMNLDSELLRLINVL